MSEQEQQEGQKTVVAFVAGLLVGGLLVWIFSGNSAESPTPDTSNEDESSVTDSENERSITNSLPSDKDEDESDTQVTSTPVLETGDGSLSVSNQAAGTMVSIDKATFPTDDGWVAVRSYNDGVLGSILGASRYSKSQGLVPRSVELLVPTISAKTYAVVFFTENGDRKFDLATDSQIEGGMTTFVAN